MEAQVVVDAQWEDTIGARICPGDSLKRARLLNTKRKLDKNVWDWEGWRELSGRTKWLKHTIRTRHLEA